jgi:hypothetical protein
MFPCAIVNPLSEREGQEKNDAAKNQNGIELQSGEHLARSHEDDDANEKETRSAHQPPAHYKFSRRGCQPAIRALIGYALGPAIETMNHT